MPLERPAQREDAASNWRSRTSRADRSMILSVCWPISRASARICGASCRKYRTGAIGW